MKLHQLIPGLLLFLAFPPVLEAQAPQFNWAYREGSTGNDRANAVALDAQGNIYTTGYFSGTVDFDPGPGITNLSCQGGVDIFVMKTDPAGNLAWVKSIGGPGNDEAFAIAVSASGNIFLTGFFCNTVDFDPGPGSFTITNADDPCNTEIFILRLDNNGNFGWAKSVEGVMTVCTAATDIGYGIGVDAAENVYVTGFWTGRADFNTSTAPADTFRLQSNGATISGDIFILKLDPSGNFSWVQQIGNALSDTGYGLYVSGPYVYVTGLYGGDADFDAGPGVDMVYSYGNWDAFVMKIDTAGNHSWAKGFGGSQDDRGFAVTTDAVGNVLVTGHFSATADFDPSAATANLSAAGGGRAVYLLKLDPAGNYSWAKAAGGNGGGERAGTAITTDAASGIYVAGYFTESVDFDLSPAPADTLYLVAPGAWTSTDAFLLKTDSLGNSEWAFSTGAAGIDRGTSVATDASGNIYTTGFFQLTADFDPGAGTCNLVSAGNEEAFVQKLSQLPLGTGENPDRGFSAEVFPNPASGTVFIRVNDVAETEILLRIVDPSGRILEEKKVPVANESASASVGMEGYAPGFYFLQIISKGKTCTEKLIRN